MPFVIEIDPIALAVIGIPVRWYGLVLLPAMAVAIAIARREGRRRRIHPFVLETSRS